MPFSPKEIPPQIRSQATQERVLTGAFVPPLFPTTCWSPSLKRLIQNAGPLPPRTAIFGLCEDGKPFLFDLNDPRPGAILIAGDRQSGKTRLLCSILASASQLNLPEEVSFGVLTPCPEEFAGFLEDRHCIGIFPSFEETTSALLSDLRTVVAIRRSGRQRNPALILAIDDLPDLLKFQSEDSRSHLSWLIQNGPQAGVWPVATIRTEMADEIGRPLLGEFRTCLVGRIAAIRPDEAAWAEENQFYVLSSSECTRFWIPNAD